VTHVIILSRFEPLATGHGGNHRTYQLQWDCIKAFGAENVTRVLASPWRPRVAPSSGRHAVLWWKLRHRLRLWYRNPRKILVREGLYAGHFVVPGLLEDYERIARAAPRPAVCVMEDVRFSDLISLNTKYDIPTVICPQNIESFDTGALRIDARFYNSVRLVDFADEFSILGRCAERLFISKVEAGLIGGLGLSARYYPYQPVGEIAQGLEAIRAKREQNRIVPGLFLIVGTAKHKATKASLRWFFDHTRRAGLPQGVRVVVVGKGTEVFAGENGSQSPGFEFRGWVEQAELDDLLSSVCGVLIPQRSGFGALTRLSELALAGLPVLVSQHPMMTMDPIAGVTVVEDDWGAWYEALRQLSHVGEAALEPARASQTQGKSVLTEVLSAV